MAGALSWMLVGLAILVLAVRRRSLAVALVTLQALVLVGLAVVEAETTHELIAAAALVVRALGLAALFLLLVARTAEPQPVRAKVSPFLRAGIAVALSLILIWLIPTIGLESRNVERAVLSLIAVAIVTAATRRATVFQILAIVLIENGLAFAALKLPGTAPLLIELGIVFDLTLVAIVAALFHHRIFAKFGAGDSAALRSLRD
jgi:hydrogenase-4 component E